MIMGETYRFGNILQWRTWRTCNAVGKIPFQNDYICKNTEASLCINSFKQCSLDQLAGSEFTIVSQSPFFVLEDKHLDAVTARE